jgi:FkbM family methyltransferase
MERAFSAKFACLRKNLRQLISGREVRFYFDSNRALYYAQQGVKKQYFAQPRRGFNIYYKGIDRRAIGMATSYFIDRMDFVENDIVIDCGANYADLFLYLRGKVRDENYISFEPGPEEFKCITLNAPNSRNFNVGLSRAGGEETFYVSSEGADSSVIKPAHFTSKIVIQTISLDDFVVSQGISRIKLFKLEAEGYEPEILEGFENSIGICEYIAIDGGYERGEAREETFSILTNKLLDA